MHRVALHSTIYYGGVKTADTQVHSTTPTGISKLIIYIGIMMNGNIITVYTTRDVSFGKAGYPRWSQYKVHLSAIYLTLTGANDLNGRSQSELVRQQFYAHRVRKYTEYGVQNSPSTDGHGLCMQCDVIK